MAREYPPSNLAQAAETTVRYIVQEGDEPARELAHAVTGKAVLPTIGGWGYLWPRSQAPDALRHGIASAQVNWLGQAYVLESTNQSVAFPAPRT